MAEYFDTQLVWMVCVCGVVTLFNRLAGHYILVWFEPIHYRVEAALEAVPMAVMVTLVVPAALTGGWVEWVSLAIAMVLMTRVPFVVAVIGAMAVLLTLRGLS